MRSLIDAVALTSDPRAGLEHLTGIARGMAVYRPCSVGVHVCGMDEERDEFFTQANFPAPSDVVARTWFERAKAELALSEGESCDFVVDLCIDDCEVEADFQISRQMLPRLAEICQ